MWAGLYSVKLSFMILYRMIFGLQRHYRLVWTLVLVYIILTYGVCLIDVFGQCSDVRHLFQHGECRHDPFTSASEYVC